MDDNKKLTFEDIMKTIEDLSHSQGFYGRLLNDIKGLDQDQMRRLKKQWSNRFTDAVDFILYIEG